MSVYLSTGTYVKRVFADIMVGHQHLATVTMALLLGRTATSISLGQKVPGGREALRNFPCGSLSWQQSGYLHQFTGTGVKI